MGTIRVDADALPRELKGLLVRASQRRGIDVVLVANHWIEHPRAPRVRMIVVKAGADVADDRIVEDCQPGDLVVTADVPLAARAVERGALVLRPSGHVLDEDSVREQLALPDLATDLREAGVPPPFGPKQRQRFASALDRWITAQAC